MSIADDIRNDSKAAKKIRLPWWGVLCAIVGGLPLVWLLDHLGRLSLALPTLDSIGMIGFAIAIKWKLRRRMWFWLTMLAIGALHVPLILFIPWTTRWIPAPVIIPFAIADLIVVLAIVSVVGKLVEGPNAPEA
ncbi:MAG: hypothetical protein DMG21_09645 [Acidobacteria bacterium]|nr:MAG: hypothetical protein DMG21_09645 [Acidobacteriota bacterium]